MNCTALYLRTATMSDIGIESQKATLENWCDKNGITNKEIYADNGFSGTKFNRPSFQKLLSDVESGKISTVITTDISRIGRDLTQTNKYLSRLSSKARYVAINSGIDSSLQAYEMLAVVGGN